MSVIKEPPYIWHNGQVKPWKDATVHVLAHGLHYGSSVFEGIRVYATPDGPAVFRLTDHMTRMFDSARIYHMPIPFDQETLQRACVDLVIANNLDSAYLRPIAFRGYGTMGVAPSDETPVDVAIAAWDWGAYLGEAAKNEGVDVCVSSWQRVAPNTMPAMAKAGGNYLSSQLIAIEARQMGFAEGIALGYDGRLSEGSGENLFLVRDGKLYTPPAGASILCGITRDSVFKLAAAEGIEVVEQDLPREMLYVVDEIFFTGTAAEITPIRSVDNITVRCGGRGPITERLQDLFFGLFNGRTEDRWGWLEPCRQQSQTTEGEPATHASAAITV